MADDRASTLIAGPPALAAPPQPDLVAEAPTSNSVLLDSSSAPRTGPVTDAGDPARARLIQRSLEIVPGLISWTLILSPLVLSLWFPAIVAWFVLTFDFYWLYKAVVLTGSVCVTFGRMRRTMAAVFTAASCIAVSLLQTPRRTFPAAMGMEAGPKIPSFTSAW